jgi:hypothetical protein
MLALFEPKPSILDHGEGDAAGRHGAVRRAYAAWLAISGPSPSAPAARSDTRTCPTKSQTGCECITGGVRCCKGASCCPFTYPALVRFGSRS